MHIADLATFEADTLFETDLAILGGGPAGLTIAREFFGTSTRVLVLESGLCTETPSHIALLELESVGEPRSEKQRERRTFFHGTSSSTWSHQLQPYGVRCRALGGSSHAWAGKSAAFDAIDFEKRSWVPYSGWPIQRGDLDTYLDRAAHVLNLGPNCYDDAFWILAGLKSPHPELDRENLRSFFWQFARSRINQFDIMRFGQEFVTFKADNIRVLLNATVTEIELDPEGKSFQGLQITTIDGARSKVRAQLAVLAAGGIENARLLLASNRVQRDGVGNGNDLVGRFLMDHAGCRVGYFHADGIAEIVRRFGFYGIRHGGRSHMYLHGLAPTDHFQKKEQLLNCAVYFSPERARDDPWDAAKRLLRRTSDHVPKDALSVLLGAGLLAKGIALKALAHAATPKLLKDFVVNTAIQLNPNLVAEEFQSRGLPHKITSVSLDAISEQRPDPDSRVTLSTRRDRFGVPLARIDWRINDDERLTILKVATLVRHALVRAGLPEPLLEPWITEKRPRDGVIIDMAHTIGTTRMSAEPKSGVVDPNCQVYAARGLYVAGSSIFPTSGHANPTLMLLALAIRLADTVKKTLR